MLSPSDLDLIRAVVREELRAAQPARAPSSPWLTVAQCAAHASVHRQTVRSWYKKGKLAATRQGRRVRIKAADLETFLSSTPATENTVINLAETVRRMRAK